MDRSLGIPALLARGLLVAGLSGSTVADDAKPQPPYVQTGVIESGREGEAILGFCVPSGGGLVAVTGVNERYGAGPRRDAKDKPPAHRVVWFDAGGAEVRSVDVDFAATVVAEAPSGDIYVAGDGVVVQLTAAGEEIARGATPGASMSDEELAESAQEFAEKRDAQLAAYDKHIERFRSTLDDLQKRLKEAEAAAAEQREEEAESADDELAEERQRHQEVRLRMMQSQARQMATQLRQIEKQAKLVRQQNPAQLVQQAWQKARQVRAISACRDGVFIVVGETSGYGYAAWRLDDRLGNPTKILSKLMGCCGQVDVQVIGGRLAVANQGHRVSLCNFAGEAVATVGAKAAAGDDGAGFGGCCNPMNTCQGPDGSLLTSESNGVVKRFDADGKFIEIVGTAEVRPGCKNSAIAIEPDGSRLYYMDSAGGKVLVLTPSAGRGDGDEDGAAKPGE